jgi:hypothetical protein
MKDILTANGQIELENNSSYYAMVKQSNVKSAHRKYIG